MSSKKIVILLVLFFSVSDLVQAQRGDVRVMFYNLENLFDTIDNPDTRDDEFLDKGDKHWSNYRYWRKINRTYQTIAAVGEDLPPEIVGVCEVEDFMPLYNLSHNTPLSKYPYSIVHKNSPDRRGIDVALLYQGDKVKLLSESFITIDFPTDSYKRTRDVLYAVFRVQTDTLHVFFNHWPSRMGGQSHSEPFRVFLAETVLKHVDSIQLQSPDAKVLIMGDFNDEPHNASLQVLKKNGLYNFSADLAEKCNCGTYKYQSQWNMLDQVLVSPALFEKKGLHTTKSSMHIFDDAFLIEPDNSKGGTKPYRTYIGPQYIGGYSDHLPVYIDLYFQED